MHRGTCTLFVILISKRSHQRVPQAPADVPVVTFSLCTAVCFRVIQVKMAKLDPQALLESLVCLDQLDHQERGKMEKK